MNGVAPLLEVERLSVEIPVGTERATVVDDVSFAMQPGETVAIVGESGGGKSLLTRAILNLLPPPARESGGAIRWRGVELLPEARSGVLGWEIGYVPQDPGRALDPTQRVGDFITAGLQHRSHVPKADARQRAVELLEAVGIPDPGSRAREYPHRLSIGTRQRVLIAAALAQSPALVIADEPTSALDATIAADVLALLRTQCQQRRCALLVVTHDLGTVAALADRVLVMYAGRVVEEADVVTFFRSPAHPYSKALLAAVPGGPETPRAILGVPPAVGARPTGCAFNPRCELADAGCQSVPPPLLSIGTDHRVACVKVTRR
ncbi:MAG: ABC transporter ATP-binding protein [Acidimicrobiia bacterium]